MDIRKAQSTRRALTRLAMVISVCVSNVWATQNPADRGTIEVTVVVRNSQGAHSYIPAAQVRLTGPTVEAGTNSGRQEVSIHNSFNSKEFAE